uniref:Uncharacterized protein LOC111109465 isoform X2 n=1 Tax=Crassostrea virginica TaxID=6565 RepID=A0A8B8BD09_CRAVI|nr:uncharacterized protein LOC111109465 isoform X2 [Crassostrea virginica]
MLKRKSENIHSGCSSPFKRLIRVLLALFYGLMIVVIFLLAYLEVYIIPYQHIIPGKENDSIEILKGSLFKIQKRLSASKQDGRSHERSCDIETNLMVSMEHNGMELKTPTDDYTAIGGTDWSFSTLIRCANITSINFLQQTNRRQRSIPTCEAKYIKLENLERINFSFKLFGSPDNCLENKIHTLCNTNLVVPNIVHFIWFGNLKFEFIYFVSIYSVSKYQRPCIIFLYYDILPSGEWWTLLVNSVPNIILVNVSPPSQISGEKIIYVQHKSDILRLLILNEYGGIYLDTDQLLLRSVDRFRNKDCTMGWAHDLYFGSALILAKKQSSFIRRWIESYASYNPKLWGENSVIMAAKLAIQYPTLINVVKHYCLFYPHPDDYYNQNYKWSHSYSLHIYKQGKMDQIQAMNFMSIRKLNNTLGAVFRYILFGNKEMCL